MSASIEQPSKGALQERLTQQFIDYLKYKKDNRAEMAAFAFGKSDNGMEKYILPELKPEQRLLIWSTALGNLLASYNS